MADQKSYWSKKTKRGVLLLVFLCLGIIYLPRFLYWLQPHENLTMSSEEILRIQVSKDKQKKANFDRKNKFSKKKKLKKPPKVFNPNDYTSEEWMNLGLSEKQAAVVLKFTKRGIYSNEDLKKVFVISDELYELIKDSTVYSERPQYGRDFDKKESISEKKRDRIELNTASQEQLESIPGIGEYFAKSILYRREKLGGFINTQQLLEVSKMDAERLEKLMPYIQLDETKVKRMNINEVTSDELGKHPYIKYNVANSIVKMRQQKGQYTSIDELKESVLINEELFQKLKPYVYL